MSTSPPDFTGFPRSTGLPLPYLQGLHPQMAKVELKQLRKDQALASESLRMLESLNTMRHNHFGHGMSEPFPLSEQEVDFVYLSCMAAVILFARMSPSFAT